MNVFILTNFLWILSEILLNRLVRSGKADKQLTDKHTELFLWITIIASIAIGVFVSKTTYFPLVAKSETKIVGIALIFLGIVIRIIAIKQLGKFFTVDVTIRKNHQLKQSGLYKFVRHPSYTGCLLSFFGFGLSLNNWIGFFLLFLPILYSFINRINIEEKVLAEQFGADYQSYSTKTKRLVPFIY